MPAFLARDTLTNFRNNFAQFDYFQKLEIILMTEICSKLKKNFFKYTFEKLFLKRIEKIVKNLGELKFELLKKEKTFI